MYEKFIFTEYISREVMDMQKKVQIVSDGSLDLSQEITVVYASEGYDIGRCGQ